VSPWRYEPNDYRGSSGSPYGDRSRRELEELDELAAAVAILDQSVNLPGQQIDTGQQANSAVALVLKLTRESRMHAGHGR
jgi:hypothetical protein